MLAILHFVRFYSDVLKKKEVSLFQAARVKEYNEFLFFESLASSSDYMQRIMVNIFKYHIFNFVYHFVKEFSLPLVKSV